MLRSISEMRQRRIIVGLWDKKEKQASALRTKRAVETARMAKKMKAAEVADKAAKQKKK